MDMSTEKAWALFDYWFEWHGHWCFGTDGKGRAERAWSKQGIDGLPAYQGARTQ
jgi:hypothetical protein